MKFQTALMTAATTIATLGFVLPAQADTVHARCEFYRNGKSRPEVNMPCTFSQRQGFVSIQWADGVRNEFTPTGDQPGVFKDRRGGLVYRQAGLGERGLIFKMEHGKIYVYWK